VERPDARALADAFTAQLNAQYEAAQQTRADAERIRAEAEAKATAAEAKLQQFLQNPASYMEAQGLNLDQWQARLLNGGEATQAEKLKAEIAAQIDNLKKEVLAPVTQVKQELEAQQRGKALNELTPVLAKDFPLVNRFMGPQTALEELRKQARATGKPLNPAQALAQWESAFVDQMKAGLQDEAVATKIGVSVKSSNAEAAVQSPRTLTNRVTSTVSSMPSRPTTDRDRIARGRELIRKLAADGQI
jgi:hypothetical protein